MGAVIVQMVARKQQLTEVSYLILMKILNVFGVPRWAEYLIVVAEQSSVPMENVFIVM